MEGSYPPFPDLLTLGALERQWLFVDHGHREMEWSTHRNSVQNRWMLRNRGVALTGPPPTTYADVPGDALRVEMQKAVDTFMVDLATWIRFEDIAWGHRYAIATLCRMLLTIRHGTITSKRQALAWASDTLDEQWRPMIEAAIAGRARGWDPTDRPATNSIRQTYEFAEHVTELAHT